MELLTEDEIRQAPKTLGLVSRYATNIDYSDGYYQGVKDAARATVERINVGVVWEGKGQFDPKFEGESSLWISDGNHGIHIGIDCYGVMATRLARQHIRVVLIIE